MGVISKTENSIIKVIEKVMLNKIKTVETLPGSWSVDLLLDLAHKAPAVFVAYRGGPAEKSNVDAVSDGKFSVYVVTKAGREGHRRKGSITAIGAYDILEAIVPHIHRLAVPDVGTLKFVNVDNLFGDVVQDLGVTVYAADFVLPQMVWPFVDVHTLDDFITFNADVDQVQANGDVDITVREILPT